ncbi:hypothetical protein BC628DRAFT_1311390 [Trametes gibbosa]|nr:hypothetical protein BC628DRAFT_1311390 [Trametes gibbosa]
MLWDVSGENNAGKTQFALQLALTVQLPQRLGGISGGACYITTREVLVTPRLEEMLETHTLLTPEFCGLTDIHTVKAPFFEGLQKVLTESVPAIADECARTVGAKPIKLLVIDTFTDIFDDHKHEVYEDIFLRARHLKKVSLLLHQLITKYHLAVITLGTIRHTYPRIDGADRSPGELRFSDQSRWFCRAHTLPGEDANEAILGHVWPNQLNARIMMSRTARTRPRSVVKPLEQDGRAPKRRRLTGSNVPEAPAPAADTDEIVPFRRFSVIFSSVGPPAYCDYVIFNEGVVGYAAEEQPPPTFLYPSPPASASSPPGSISVPTTQESGPSAGFSRLPQITPPSTSSPTQSQPWYQQSLSYASRRDSRSTSASVPPPSQSVVPSSQPDQDDDWDMYVQDSQADDHLYASVDERLLAVPSIVEATGTEDIEEAEDGPPAEKGSDSDYYWDGDNDDALYTDL